MMQRTEKQMFDLKYIENLEFYNVESIEILNRWGNSVYQNTSYENDWQGDNLPDGTYFYIVKIEEREEAYRGTVLIHR